MARFRRRRPSPAMAVALLALFVALGGSSYAAIQITGKQIKDNSITTKDIKNHSLLKKDFKRGQLPRGRRGAQGLPGANGATNVTVRSTSGVIPSSCSGASSPYICSGDATLTAPCAAGERATGGGYKNLNRATIVENRANVESGTPTGWMVHGTTVGSSVSPGPGTPASVTVYAVCAAP